MTLERNKAYADALISVATAEARLPQVQDELFQIGRIVRGSDELTTRLADAAMPAARRQQLVEDLLGGRANPVTIALVSMIVAAGRGRDLPDIAEQAVVQAAKHAGRQVAVVRSAIELTDDQKTRLGESLSRATGGPVDVRVVIDPNVLGGIVAEVGDTVIDGSIRRRLDQLKQAI